MVFVVPPVLIVAAWRRGCRPSERPLIAAIACIGAGASAAALAWALSSEARMVDAVAYALTCTTTVFAAMLIRQRPEDDDGPGGEGEDDPKPDLPPVDWDEFERRFWEEVARRPTPKIDSDKRKPAESLPA